MVRGFFAFVGILRFNFLHVLIIILNIEGMGGDEVTKKNPTQTKTK